MTQRPINLGQPVNRDCSFNRGLWAWFLRMPQFPAATRMPDLCGSVAPTIGLGGLYGGPSGRSGGRGSFETGPLSNSRWYAASVRRSVTCSAYSVAFWASPTSTTANQYLCSTDNTGNSFSAVLGYDDGYWNIYRGSYPTGIPSQSRIAATANVWQHVCYTFTGSRVLGYLNGVVKIDVACSWASITISTLNLAQATSAPVEMYSGKFDDLRIWSRGLNASEVQQLYADSRAGYPRSLNYLDTDAHLGFASSAFTASSSLFLPAFTTSLSGTFTKPTYSASASLSLPAITETSSGTFTSPTYTATSNISLAPQVLASSGTFSIPDRTATSAVSIAPLTVAITGTFTKPTYTATAVFSLPEIELSSSGSFTAPTYTASSAVSLGPQSLSGTGTFAVHTYTASSSLSLAGLTFSASGTFITVNTGTASLATGAVTLAGSGTFTSPVYTASMAVSYGALTLSASATFQALNNEATASLSLAPLTLAGAATYQPVYAATTALSLGALTLVGVAWLNPPVFYLEWSDSGESTVVDSLEGSSVVTEQVTGDCTVVDTITGSIRLRLTTTP